MAPRRVLDIRLRASEEPPPTGRESCNVHLGGPLTLLRWLETSLGLQADNAGGLERTARYAALLASADGESFRASFATDRWATSAELLARRDALSLAGWKPQPQGNLPALVNDLAAAEAAHPAPPSDAERLADVLQALDDGQRLPPHRVLLAEPVEVWPPAWRAVLARLTTEHAPLVVLGADPATALRAAQDLALGGAVPGAFAPDPSFRFVAARSRLAAAQALAAMLADGAERVPDTVIVCEDEDTALLLDRALARVGLPTMGAGRNHAAQPALQVLPLALALCWDPVDPQLLLEFLTLPFSPAPSPARFRLARALTKQPGLGSEAWEAAWARATATDVDPDGKDRERLEAWLSQPRYPRGGSLPTAAVAARCSQVAQWAMGRAQILEQAGKPEDADLAEAFRTASGQAKVLGDLVLTLGTDITQPQLERLVEEVLATGAVAVPLVAAAGGPRLLRSLAELDAPCDRLVWLGTSTEDAPASPWTPTELRALQAAGVEVDDGSRALRVLREAERRGLALVRERLLVVRLPQDAEARPHPLLLQLHGAMPRQDGRPYEPPGLEDALAGDGAAVAPWRLAAREVPVQPMHPPRPLWQLPAELLTPPAHASASELMDRLGCPLKWVLRYPADIGRGHTLTLPMEHTLKGNLSHAVLARVLGQPGPLPPPPAVAEAVGRVFDERLGLDAAPLALPAKAGEAARLRARLLEASERLAEALHAGGYHVVGMEAPLEGDLLGRPPLGGIDCRVATDEGEEAVLDFKLSGSKHRKALEEGRAVQLAVYAAAREQAGRRVGGVGYLIIEQARLHTPEGSPLQGVPVQDQVRGARGFRETWAAFVQAMQVAEDWLRTGEVPARPLSPGPHPGAELVLAEGWDGTPQPCEYCPYGALCGREARP